MINFFVSFWQQLGIMSPYLLLGFAAAGVLKVCLPDNFVQKHLAGGKFASVVKASLLGVPLPLCSCSVLPAAVSLRKSGAGKGAAISFLLSTPQTGIDSIFATYSMLGFIFAVLRPIIAFITGIIGGCAVHLLAQETPNTQKEEDSEASKNRNKFAAAVRHGFIVLPKDISAAMLLGIFAAAAIAVFVPEDFFTEKIGTGLGSMFLMLLVGIPVYVCATASVPIAAAMIAKGLSPGAALVFLMTGPATNIASFILIWNIFGSRTAVIYILTVVICAMLFGLLLNEFFPDISASVQRHYHKSESGILENISAAVLLALLLFGIYKKHFSKN